jgi:hypothetical protein
MTAQANGSQLTSDSDLPVVRPPVTPAETTAPDDSAPDASQAGPPVAVSYPPPPDLAASDRRRRTERRSRKLLIEASFRMQKRVGHPDGGDCPVEEVLEHEAAQRAQIDRDAADASVKHRRLPSWLRRIPAYVLGFDLGLLLYFFAGITDVNWASPISMALAFAIMLAAMVTLLSFGFLAFTGHRLRGYKNHDGTIDREEFDGFTRAAAGLALAVIAVLALLMFLRIRAEVLGALGGQAVVTAWVIAAAVAVVSVVANFLVITVHAFDGSDETARLDRLSAAVRRPVAEAHRMREEAAKKISRLSPAIT